MEIIIESDMFGLFNTNFLHRNASPASGPAVLFLDDDMASLPTHNLAMWQAHHLRT
jgi:hypothetical protein